MITNNFNDSIILIDKPEGETSFQTISKVKKLLCVKKVGHSGTLDKFASGLLVVCTGFATKLTRYFLEDDKRYIGKIKLGITTDTLDEEGNIIEEKPTNNLQAGKINDAVLKFIGEIHQTPPQYSSLKINGKRASDLARAGKRVELKERKIKIFSINILDIDLENAEVTVDVSCSKGTYIRSLARDIGNELGTGAYLKSLRRIKSGNFDIRYAMSIEEIESYLKGNSVKKIFFLSPDEALVDYSRITVKNDARKKILNGIHFKREDILNIEHLKVDTFCIKDEDKNLLALADVELETWNVKYLNVFNQNE